jgi:hypothetical protein
MGAAEGNLVEVFRSQADWQISAIERANTRLGMIEGWQTGRKGEGDRDKDPSMCGLLHSFLFTHASRLCQGVLDLNQDHGEAVCKYRESRLLGFRD